uniref:Uncharacterized protein n=1 Tax=Anopheles coluzzii TaxID=1518534 RepID=A0A8W7Q3P4_ANOCL
MAVIQIGTDWNMPSGMFYLLQFYDTRSNSGSGTVQNSIRLPLAGLAPPRVLMCSASMGAEGSVTLQLREAVQAPDAAGSLDGALTIGYPDPDMLADMLGTFQGASTGASGDPDAGSFELLQDSNGSPAGATLRTSAAEQLEQLAGAILTKANSSGSSSGNATTGATTVTIKTEPDYFTTYLRLEH